MRGYGLPRHPDLDAPDLVDIGVYGMKTSTGQLQSQGGDYHGSTRKHKRNRQRRFWKKQERVHAKRDIYKELH